MAWCVTDRAASPLVHHDAGAGVHHGEGGGAGVHHVAGGGAGGHHGGVEATCTAAKGLT